MIICLNCNEEIESRQGHHCVNELSFVKSRMHTNPFLLWAKGDKKFELRKNDRDYQVGDYVVLYETIKGVITNKELQCIRIVYVLKGVNYGLKKGYCIFNW